MGIYDQLSQLSKTPPVAASEPAKTVEAPQNEQLPKPTPKLEKKAPTAPRKETPRNEFNPKSFLDRPTIRHRIITRASFEVYQDQVHVLRQVSLSAKLSGEQLSISEMVREALDSYLTDKNLK